MSKREAGFQYREGIEVDAVGWLCPPGDKQGTGLLLGLRAYGELLGGCNLGIRAILVMAEMS